MSSIRPRSGRIMKHPNPTALRKLAIAFAIVVAATVVYVSYIAPHTLEAKTRAKLESTQTQLLETQLKLNDQQTKNAKERQEKLKELEEVNKKLQETEKQLQAKRSVPKTDIAVAAPRPIVKQFTGGGQKEDWMRAAGIPEGEWWAVDYIVSREAGWNPCAYNPGKSDCNATPTSACGLAQALPCSKVGPNWQDPVVSLKWQYNYVTQRYGGYSQAVAFWQVYKWY